MLAKEDEENEEDKENQNENENENKINYDKEDPDVIEKQLKKEGKKIADILLPIYEKLKTDEIGQYFGKCECPDEIIPVLRQCRKHEKDFVKGQECDCEGNNAFFSEDDKC